MRSWVIDTAQGSERARFPRRLIEERRIRYVKVGRHVRIPESAVEEFIQSRTVEPIRFRGTGLRWAA
ncbi:excisionase family DNA-binding protein [Streptomyces sp. NPDC057301]|uniref:excisionase family DNA-binding protein n=1 Tax=Streptomyces sp. NPDC057301 TaxID=3346093 RepID=UPI0036307389